MLLSLFLKIQTIEIQELTSKIWKAKLVRLMNSYFCHADSA